MAARNDFTGLSLQLPNRMQRLTKAQTIIDDIIDAEIERSQELPTIHEVNVKVMMLFVQKAQWRWWADNLTETSWLILIQRRLARADARK